MIEKLSPSLELALQNELRQAYLKGVETGRKMEQNEQKLREAVGTLNNKCGGYCHQAKNGEIFSCGCMCCK